MKRLVICCDGTWNTPDQDAAGVPLATNVTRIAEAIAPQHDDVQQLVFYHTGVGTSGSRKRRYFDGYTGSGVTDAILAAYQYVIEQYEPGDQLFLLGFSRGAFTVRSLAGLIRSCGVLRRDALDILPRAFSLYRARSPATHPREREATLFRRTYAVENITPIWFIGVWDTVGALGNPLLFGQLSPSNRFHDTDLSTTVRHAYQALAIDEKRHFFQASLWKQQAGVKDQLLEQVWFCGAHANVGGGYANIGLSDIALDWLANKARDCGLSISVITTKPDALGLIVESRCGLYRLIPTYYRPIADPAIAGVTHESLHPSVVERYAKDSTYRPRNLEEYFARSPALLPIDQRA